MTSAPSVSVIVPCRNEEGFIGDCLTSIAGTTFPKDRLEMLVVDGMSDDATRAIIAAHADANPAIVRLDNPDRIVPSAMNIGIRHATGEIIVRLDAHARYPQDYIAKVVEWLEKSGADNVGGVCLTRPANETPMARAIAAGLSHPFGVGNSYFRIGTREPRWVDTVPFGCYRRSVFDRIGLFDEDLVRNQDDELNARLIRRGGRILLVPEIVSEYYARDTLGKLWRMYYEYGYFKPLVARKVGGVMTVRQVLPALLAGTLLAGAALAGPFPVMRAPFAAVLATYVLADVVCAIRAGWKHGAASALWLMAVFPVLHFSYGLGYLKGIADFVIRNRRRAAHGRALTPSR